MNIFKIKDLYESLGKEKFTKEIDRRIKDPDICLLKDASDRDWHGIREAVDSGTFVHLIGSRVALKVREGYELVKNPLEMIFPVEPSSLKKETVIGMTGPAGLEEVKEGMNYEAKGIGELKLEYDNTKYGELVEITWETIKFDRYNAVIKVAGRVGEDAKLKEAELAAAALLDSGDTGYDGSGIYVSGHSNLGTTALATAALETVITAMREQTDDDDKPIMVTPKWLCVCEDLRIPALKLIKSILEPGTIENDVNILREEGLEVVSVPFWTSTNTTWIVVGTKMGANRGFVKNEVLPIEIYTRRGQNTDEGFRRDIEASWKVRLMCNYHCEDYKYAYKGKA